MAIGKRGYTVHKPDLSAEAFTVPERIWEVDLGGLKASSTA